MSLIHFDNRQKVPRFILKLDEQRRKDNATSQEALEARKPSENEQ